MSRTKTFFIGNNEDIAEYYHNVVTGNVKVSVGTGIIQDNEFKFLQPQTYETYEISGEPYEQLIAADEKTGKPYGTFRKDDLWDYIDQIRQNTTVEAVTRIAEARSNGQPQNIV